MRTKLRASGMVQIMYDTLFPTIKRNMEDTDLMPYGKYEGKQMADVPANYLLWLWDNRKCSGSVKLYINRNMKQLRDEAKKAVRIYGHDGFWNTLND